MADPETIFSEEEKARVRYHMGYLNTDPVLTITLGVPSLTQPAFILEGALNRLPQSRAQILRMLLGRLDTLDNDIFESRRRLKVRKVDEIEMNPTEPDDLEREYVRQAKRMSDFLGAPLNPYSTRWLAGRQPLSIPVRN